MHTDDLDFHLPHELIAQTPSPERAASRLLHYRRGDRSIGHLHFSDLPRLLRKGDLLVFNDARVVPARFMLRKSTGGRVEGLFLSEEHPGRWRVLLKNLKQSRQSNAPSTPGQSAGSASDPSAAPDRAHDDRQNPDTDLHLVGAPEVKVRVLDRYDRGECVITVNSIEPALQLLARIGRMPLPPYIKRDREHDPRDESDRQRYQTIYARHPGAVAAPTAGLHFTDELMKELDDRGIERTFVTLHVGIGTFRPVTAGTLEAHDMHSEAYTISPEAADALNRAKDQARRIIAVGTTSARVLESQPVDEPFTPKTADTSIFIYPSYQWKHVSAMITNFHLPRSTLIAMIAALVGLDEQRRIYQTAIEQRYRFFSYGDAMFVE